MYKHLSTGLVLISAFFFNTSAMASQNCDNFGVNTQNPHTETKTVTNTNCNNDERSSEWRNDEFSNTEIPGINSLDQSATCIVANCRSRLKEASSHKSASLSTPETTKDLIRSKTSNAITTRRFLF